MKSLEVKFESVSLLLMESTAEWVEALSEWIEASLLLSLWVERIFTHVELLPLLVVGKYFFRRGNVHEFLLGRFLL